MFSYTLRAQAHTRTTAQPSRPRACCFCGAFSPSRRQIRCTRSLPTAIPQQHRDAPVAVAPILRRQGQDRLRQLVFVRGPQRQVALCPSPLPHHSARPPLTYFMLLASMLHGAAPGLEVSLRISFRICLSNDSSATSRFNLPFFFFQFLQPLRLVHLQTAVTPSASGRTPGW